MTSYISFNMPADVMKYVLKDASADVLTRALLTKIRDMEGENGELRTKLGQLSKDATRERAQRHLERYRKRREQATKDGDFAAAALQDQRVKALEALLEP